MSIIQGRNLKTSFPAGRVALTLTGAPVARWMKLISKDEHKVIFRLGKREKETLLAVLKLYPALGTSFQRLSKSEDPLQMQADQELLEQSLAEHKELNREFLKKLFANPERLTETKQGCRLTLEPGEIEWFLQVLNDVRVGKWYQAGCPDESAGKPLDITVENLHHLWAMEVAGAFQWQIIEAMDEFGY